MKNCPKCASVVKEWDIVCPVCGSTLRALSEPKNFVKVKGDLPGWGDFKATDEQKAQGEAGPPQGVDADFDKRLVRAAIKSDYEKGKEPPGKALRALGQVSFLEGQVSEHGRAGGGDDVEELEGVEEIDEEDAAQPIGADEIDKLDIADEIGPEDIMESDEVSHGPIVVEGKKRAPQPAGQAPAGKIEELLGAPPPASSTGEVKAAPIPRVAPPPQGAPAQVAAPPQHAAPASQAMSAPVPAGQPQQQAPFARPAPAPDIAGAQAAAPMVGGAPQQDRSRQPRTTQPIALGSSAQPSPAAAPASPQPGPQPRQKAAAGRQTLRGAGEPAGTPAIQRSATNSAVQQQYDPETLRRIMQQAQAAAMMRKTGKEGTRISLPLAVLLIVMGTLSILGIAVIMYLLIST